MSFNNNFCKYYDKKCNTESFSSEYSVYFVFLIESKKTPDSRKIMLYSNMGFRYKVKAI